MDEQMQKNKHTWLDTFFRLCTILPLCLNVMKQFICLVETEAHLAKKKVIIILVAILCFLLFLSSAWLCFIAMLFIYLLSLQLGYFISLLFIFILNLLLLVITILIIANTQNEIFFPKTRRLLFHDKK